MRVCEWVYVFFWFVRFSIKIELICIQQYFNRVCVCVSYLALTHRHSHFFSLLNCEFQLESLWLPIFMIEYDKLMSLLCCSRPPFLHQHDFVLLQIVIITLLYCCWFAFSLSCSHSLLLSCSACSAVSYFSWINLFFFLEIYSTHFVYIERELATFKIVEPDCNWNEWN